MRFRSRQRTGGPSTCRDGWPGIGLMLVSHDYRRLKPSPDQPDQNPQLASTTKLS